ncbi:MAG: glycoside hydrolase family protein [Thermosynechococcaceae cyanobacterium]
MALALLGLATVIWPRSYSKFILPLADPGDIAPLAMSGGSPHIRALMRTISASESNDESPYTLFYGGTHFTDLSQHPDRCITIVAGPNKNNCTTAAGRYQFINTTWAEKAKAYHPKPTKMLMMWKHYSFEPMYQDRVVYAWLADDWVWDMDIEDALEAGQVQRVFKRLSGTWTSLGYGIEDNVVTPKLAKIYQRLLAEELASANNTTTAKPPQS